MLPLKLQGEGAKPASTKATNTVPGESRTWKPLAEFVDRSIDRDTKKCGSLELVQRLSEGLPSRRETFDRSVTSCSSRDARNEDLSLTECFRACKLNGKLAVIDIGKPNTVIIGKNNPSIVFATSTPYVSKSGARYPRFIFS